MIWTNIAIIVTLVIILGVFWGIVALRHLNHLRKEIDFEWELIDLTFGKRYDLLPNLIETIRLFRTDQETLLQEIIKLRSLVVKQNGRDRAKIELDYDLSVALKNLLHIAKGTSQLATETNFLEITKEIKDLEKNIEEKTRRYNEMVRFYNKRKNLSVLKPVASVAKLPDINIFEVEF